MDYEITKGMRIIGAKCLERKEERATQTMEATINMIHKKISNIKQQLLISFCNNGDINQEEICLLPLIIYKRVTQEVITIGELFISP